MTNDEVNRWKLSAERIAELRGFIDQLLSTHNMYECIAIRDMLSEEITHEPSEQRSEVNSIDDVAAICHSVTGLCCHILGSPGGPCTIGNCAAVRGYLGGPEFAQGASRDASPYHVDATGTTREPPHCPTCDCGTPADLVGALQDVVHTDPGPVRAAHAVKLGVFAEILSHHPDCSFHSTVAPATPVCDCGAGNPPPCECLVRDKEPSAYHNVKCPRYVADKL